MEGKSRFCLRAVKPAIRHVTFAGCRSADGRLETQHGPIRRWGSEGVGGARGHLPLRNVEPVLIGGAFE